MSEIDWRAIRSDYEDGLSLRKLAAKYGISKSVIGDRKYSEKWDQRRTDARTVNRTDSNTQGVINRDVNAAVRVADAIRYRQAGWTYERIAQQCGYGSPGAARNAVQRELGRVIVQNIEEWRNDHTARLEKQHETIWPLAVPEVGGKVNLFAHDRLLAISEREAKLLGLDAKPDESDVPQVIIEEVPVGYLRGPST